MGFVSKIFSKKSLVDKMNTKGSCLQSAPFEPEIITKAKKEFKKKNKHVHKLELELADGSFLCKCGQAFRGLGATSGTITSSRWDPK